VTSTDECVYNCPSEAFGFNKATPSELVWVMRVENSGRKNKGHIWLDTMASHSITNDIKLFGTAGPCMECDFTVNGWQDGNSTSVSRAGWTSFGFMLYCESASGTIVSSYEMKQYWDIKWASNDIAATISRNNIVLDFDQNCSNRVLQCQLSSNTYTDLCSDINLVSDSTHELMYEGVNKAVILEQGEYKRALEAMYMHKVTCHASYDNLCWSLRGNLLSNCPIDEHDIANICFLCESPCPCCAAGKSFKSRHNNKHVYGDVESYLPDKAYVFNKQDSEGETIGLDFFFVDSAPYLIGVGLKSGYIHTVNVTKRNISHTRQAIELIIKDYSKHNVTVKKLFNIQPSELNIIRTASDNESAILAATMDLFPLLKISGTFTVPGEHVSYVERKIRTIKERVAATRVSLEWIPSPKLIVWLVHNVVTWMNLLFSKKSPNSAWKRVYGGQCNYRDLTRTRIFDFVIAHRTDSVSGGQAKGELGISLGTNPRQPGAIYFYSLASKQVKSRVRFMKIKDLDIMKYGFKKNNNHIAQLSLDKNYLTYVHQRQRESVEGVDISKDDDSNVIVPLLEEVELDEGAKSLESESEEPAVMLTDETPEGSDPLNGTFFNEEVECELSESLNQTTVEPSTASEDMRADVSIDPEGDLTDVATDRYSTINTKKRSKRPRPSPEAKNVIRTRSKSRQHKVADLPDIVDHVMQEAMIVKICAASARLNSTDVNWKKAELELGSKATEKIMAELEQICCTYDVGEPVKHFVANFHMSHDLYDTSKDKARLVIGKLINDTKIDYGVKTNSPTINGKIIFLLLSLALQLDLNLEVWDVKGAFLKSPLHTDGVYVKINPAIAEKMVLLRPEWKVFQKANGSLMLRCKKGWYGLAVASMLWYNEIEATLVNECGYTKHEMEPCLFYKGEGLDRVFIMLHVDDMGVLAPKNSTVRDDTLAILERKYEKLKVQTGDKVKYIGLELHRNRDAHRFEVKMSDYLSKIGEVHHIDSEGVSNIRNPASNARFSKPLSENDPKNYPFKDTLLYRSLVMSMQYGTTVLPSVKYHVIHLATKQSNPTQSDYEAAVHVLKYMLKQKHKPVLIYACGENPDIYVYHDAAFDVYPDSISHSGISVFIGNAGAAIYSCSGKQKCMTQSSTAAEIVAGERAVTLGDYFMSIMRVMGHQCSVIYYGDNLSMICLVETGCRSYDRTSRHMIRKINFLHAYYQEPDNHAILLYCNTKDMIADIGTKDLHGSDFNMKEDILMGHT